MAAIRDRIESALDDGGIDEAAWGDRIEDLLYEGETVEETVSVQDSQVVVTSHRVLTFTPDLEGPNFRGVERPNVVGVTRGAAAAVDHLVRGVKWTVIGVIMVAAGVLIDMDSIVGSVNLDATAGDQVGLGGVVGLVQQILGLIRQLDDLLQVLGALAMLLGVAILGFYVWTRDPTLDLEVSGDEDLKIPRPEDELMADRLEAAIAPGPGEEPFEDSPSDHGGTLDAGDDPLAEP